jgi:uncharacterized protein YndB with AHSA1/START domain
MTSPVQHTTFAIERMFATSPAHAFRFWSDPALKTAWNACHPDWTVTTDIFDFRPGGTEAKVWRTPEGHHQTFTAHYLDILPAERIIYAYEMTFAGQRLSASLVTILLTPAGSRTRMTYTEQVAILSADADAAQQRLMGTEQGIDRLAALMPQDAQAAQPSDA